MAGTLVALTGNMSELSTLSKISQLSHNLDELLIKSVKHEKNITSLVSPLKDSPKSLRKNDITSVRTKRNYHPKLKVIGGESPNDSALSINVRSDFVYNLLGNCGNDSVLSDTDIQNMSKFNSEMIKVNQHSTFIGSDTKFITVENPNVKTENMETDGVGSNLKTAPKRIVFLIPAELEGTVEIMKVKSVASVGSQVKNPLTIGDTVFSGINPAAITTLCSPITTTTVDSKNATSAGPIKRKAKRNRKKRASPYTRRDDQNNNNLVKRPSEHRESTLKNAILRIPENYVPQDYHQTRSSVGPIRSKTYRNSVYKQPENSRFNQNSGFNNNAGTYNYSSQYRFTDGNYHQRRQYPGDPYVNPQNRNYWNKPYNQSRFRQIKLCWSCGSNSHLKLQCPFKC